MSLFVPPEQREALWTLFAFNHEIAKTREVVSETRLGLIRLQWWREEIGKIYDGQEVSTHEVLGPLSRVITRYELPRDEFEALIYAREFDLEDVLPSNLEGLIHYADFTTTPLVRLTLRITGGEPDMEPVQAVAVNYALSGLLRAVPIHARQRRCYLPDDLLRQNNVYVNQIYEGKPQDGLSDVIAAVADQITTGVGADNKALKAMQGLAVMCKKQLQSLGHDIYHPRMALGPGFKALRLFAGVCFL